eukprot:829702-Amphidinium_carterae.1
MMSQKGWWMNQCFEQAVEWCPEVFQGLHKDTMRRWWEQVKNDDKQTPRRKHKVPSPVVQKIAVSVMSLVNRGACLNISVVKGIAEKVILTEMFEAKTVS